MSFDALGGKKKNCSLNGKFFFIFSDTIISPILRKKVRKKYFPKFILILHHLDPNSWIRLFLRIRAGSKGKTLFCSISRRDQVYPDLSTNLQTCVLALVNLDLKLGLGIRNLIHHPRLFEWLIDWLIGLERPEL